MAGYPMGAHAPASPATITLPPTLPTSGPGGAPYRIPTTTRTRRLHAVFALGDDLASVHSTRREVEARGVIVTLCNGAQWQAVRMLPAQARSMARTLIDAAEAVELSQRQAQRARHDARDDRGAGLALVSEGGAA